MEQIGINRRQLMAKAGAMATGAAAPFAMTAGGIIIPSIARAETLAAPTNNLTVERNIAGQTITFRQWRYSSGEVLTFASSFRSSRVMHVKRVHKIGRQEFVTRYAGGSFNSTEGSLILPSTHAHRALKSKVHLDHNGNGTDDGVPNIRYPSGTTVLMDFDSLRSWSTNLLKFRRYRLNGVIHVQGAMKDINAQLENGWYIFDFIGSRATEFLTRFNEANSAWSLYSSSQNISHWTLGAGVVVLAGTAAFLVAATACPPCGLAGGAIYPAVVGMCGVGATLNLVSGNIWIAAGNSHDKFRLAVNGLEAFVTNNSNLRTVVSG